MKNAYRPDDFDKPKGGCKDCPDTLVEEGYIKTAPEMHENQELPTRLRKKTDVEMLETVNDITSYTSNLDHDNSEENRRKDFPLAE